MLARQQRDDGGALPHRHRPLQAGQRPPRAPRPATRSSRGSHARSRRRRPVAATASAATSTACWSRARAPTPSARRRAAADVRGAARRSAGARAGDDQRGHRRYPFHADDLHSLKKRADMALYQSKFNGRDRSTLYTGLPGESDRAATSSACPSRCGHPARHRPPHRGARRRLLGRERAGARHAPADRLLGRARPLERLRRQPLAGGRAARGRAGATARRPGRRTRARPRRRAAARHREDRRPRAHPQQGRTGSPTPSGRSSSGTR